MWADSDQGGAPEEACGGHLGKDHRPGEERRRWRRPRSPSGAGARHPGAGGRRCRGRDRRRAGAGCGNQRFIRGRRADGEAVKGAVGERRR
ncbi:unnamed protein product, partial [Ectocarpus sp. 12 AP-2014]